MNRGGIIAGGNWIVDHVKLVDRWPEQDTLASIRRHSISNGGAAYNVLVDLARLKAPFPLEGIGRVGNDANGRWILEDCARYRIRTPQLHVTDLAPTSFTDVMTVEGSGRRTFFHSRGANATLTVDDFEFAGTEARVFHLGYLLLLDGLDTIVQGRPLAVNVLEAATRSGVLTSLDCVSEAGARFASVIVPALPFVDILFANDYEAEQLTGLALRRQGVIAATAVGQAARQLLKKGVRKWVVIHFPEAAYACDRNGNGYWQPSVRVSSDEIAGAAGAGDALAAGVLYGLHEEWPMPEALRLGACCAATSLRYISCSEGVGSVADCIAFGHARGYHVLPP